MTSVTLQNTSHMALRDLDRIGRFWKTAVWTLETCMIWSRHQWHHRVLMPIMQLCSLKSESNFDGFHSAPAIWPGSIVRSHGRGKLQWPNVCRVAKATTSAKYLFDRIEWHAWCCKVGTSELWSLCILSILCILEQAPYSYIHKFLWHSWQLGTEHPWTSCALWAGFSGEWRVHFCHWEVGNSSSTWICSVRLLHANFCSFTHLP